MGRNIVLCCDGTNNQFDGDHTNVIRTYKVLRIGPEQLAFYDPGVGTMPEPWQSTRIAKRWSMIKGLAFGSGFLENIQNAYCFLMTHYREGDRVFLFGFSRGAFTARGVAALLHSVGLLYPGTENLIPYAIKYWRKDFGPASPGGRLCDEFRATLARPCPVHFIGVWDTVSSVGFINNFRSFPHTAHNPEVTHIRHAVSIDERRSTFRQNLMHPVDDKQDVKNVWFAGVHSDVGGGYPPSEAGLAKVTFEWMMAEAHKNGLDLDPTAYDRELNQVGARIDPCAPLHVSLHGLWRVVQLLPYRGYSAAAKRRVWRLSPVKPPRNVLRDADRPHVLLHSSVAERFAGCPDYRPRNLPGNEQLLRGRFRFEPRSEVVFLSSAPAEARSVSTVRADAP